MGCTRNTLKHPWRYLQLMLGTTDLWVAKWSRHVSLQCVCILRSAQAVCLVFEYSVSMCRCVFSPPQCISSWLTKHSVEEGLTSIPPLIHPSISSSPSPLPSLVYCAAERSSRQTSPGCDLIKGRRVNVMNSQPITLIWAHLTCLQGARDRLRVTERERERQKGWRGGCGGVVMGKTVNHFHNCAEFDISSTTGLRS